MSYKYVQKHADAKDSIVEAEAAQQKRWEVEGSFYREVDDSRTPVLVTFPFPYMNGVPHLGHGLTMVQADAYARFMDAFPENNVLFPFGFHGTGMPIAASALRLQEELTVHKTDFGSAPQGSKINTLLKMGVPDSEIGKFVDPYHWLKYFPGKATTHLKRFGLMVDFRRSFITTDMNPWFDSFIRWQFSILHAKNYLTFGKRHVIYSIKDGQPCADHDRSSGEGVGTKQYAVVLMKLKKSPLTDGTPLMKGDDVYLAVATLRVETMFGQTNVWVNPTTDYSLIKVGGKKILAQSEMYRNIAMQQDGVEMLIKDFIRGEDLLWGKAEAPLSEHKEVYITPCIAIKSDVGTGIVTSVPAHSPFDHYHFQRLIKDDRVPAEVKTTLSSMEFVSLISVKKKPNFALDEIAKAKLKPGQTQKMQVLHEKLYKNEQAKGMMSPHLGEFGNLRVVKAQEKVMDHLKEAGVAFDYHEPESVVISRSNDRCVVALTDQWFINYGDPGLKKTVKNHLEKMNIYTPETVGMFNERNAWLGEWPVSREFGLGTKLLDTDSTIDSLSDSTIYMAYYTVAHLIQALDQKSLSIELWNYIFYKDQSFPTNPNSTGTGWTSEEESLIKEMRTSFRYWYPVSLRVSGVDLVGNHLLMALYNHAIIWEDEPELWPQGYAINGFVVVDCDKMSKDKGNFMTLNNAIDTFGADPTRIALAESGEGISEANFELRSADTAVTFLATEYESLVEMRLKETDKEYEDVVGFWEKAVTAEFYSRMKAAKHEYENINLRRAMHEIRMIIKLRDEYRYLINSEVIGGDTATMRLLNQGIVAGLTPIAPHWGERAADIWDEKIAWPTVYEDDVVLIVLRKMLNRARSLLRREADNVQKSGASRSDIVIECKLVSSLGDDCAVVGAFPDEFTKAGWKSHLKVEIGKVDRSQKGTVGGFCSCLYKMVEEFNKIITDPTEDIGQVIKDLLVTDPELINDTLTTWLPILLVSDGFSANITILETPPKRYSMFPGILYLD